jgi:2,4-dienoyl-CoA reductase-like NADH-dependent reductase (Old Yellow Enzyme family)
VEGGWTPDDSARLVQELAPLGLDLVDCSSGGTVMNANIPVGPGYQVHLAAGLRAATSIPTGAVGSITESAQAEAIVAQGQADIVLLGRQLLREPYWALRAAQELGVEVPWPSQYAWSVGNPG